MDDDLFKHPDSEQDHGSTPGEVVNPNADKLEQRFSNADPNQTASADTDGTSKQDPESLYNPSASSGDGSSETGQSGGARSSSGLLNRLAGKQSSLGTATKVAGLMKSKKGAGLAGIIVALTLMIVAMLLFFPSLKLIHFTENIRDYFDGPMTEEMQRRLPKHYRVITSADDGKIRGFEENGSIFGRVARSALYADLESRGFEPNFSPNGSLESFTVNGETIDADQRLFRGQRGNRKLLRNTLSDLYPEEGWIRRGARARILYTRLGLRLGFSQRITNALYDKFGERLDDRLTRGKARLRQTLFGDYDVSQNSGVNSGSIGEVDDDGNPTSNNNYADDVAGDSGGLSDRANTLRQNMLDNPEESFRQSLDYDDLLEKAGREGVEGTFKGGLRGFFGSGFATAGDYTCRAKILSSNIETGSKILRSQQLIKYAFEMLRFADHMKAGVLTSGEVSARMAVLDQVDENGRGNMADSGAWRFISGDKSATPSGNDLNKYGGGRNIPFISRTNRITNSIPGGRNGCRVITNPIFQIGAGVGSAVLSIGSLGTFEVLDSAVSIGAGAAGEVLLSIGETIMTQMVAGTVVTGDETGSEAVSAMMSGASSLSSQRAMAGGGMRATNAHYAAALRKAHDGRVNEQAQKSFLARLFNTEDHRSFIAKVAIESPNSPTQFLRNSSTSPLRTTPQSALAWVDNTINSSLPHTAYAQLDPDALAVDMFGNPVFLLDSTGLASFEPEENEQFLMDNGYIDGDNADEYQDYVDACFTTYSIELLENEGCREPGPNNIFQRFRVYRTDQGGAQMLCEYTTGELCPFEDEAGAADLPTNTTPAGAEVVGDPYETSVSVACASGTSDLGVHDAYVSGNKVDMRLCALSNMTSTSSESQPGSQYYIEGANGQAIVNSRVSGAAYKMIQDAKIAGITLEANSSFRTMAHQTQLFEDAGRDSSRVATPGGSSHQAGVAIDFLNMGSYSSGVSSCASRAQARGNSRYDWLVENAANYGYKQYMREPWHWDMLNNETRC